MLRKMNKEAVMNLDLGPIRFKLNESLGWTKEKVDKSEMAYKRFLFLSGQYPDETVVPIGGVDDFWHYHIMDTYKYKEDCENIFGDFLHHFPYFGVRGEEDVKNLETAIEKTELLYIKEFGENPPKTNIDDAKCGGDMTCGASLFEKNKSDMNTMHRPSF